MDALKTLGDEAEIKDKSGQKKGKPSKSAILNRIHGQIGFGGMIHTFKDLEIRREEALAEKLKANLAAILSEVAATRRIVHDTRVI